MITSDASEIAVVVADEDVEASASRAAGLWHRLEMQKGSSRWAQTEYLVTGSWQLDSGDKVEINTTHPFNPRPLPPSEKRVK